MVWSACTWVKTHCPPSTNRTWTLQNNATAMILFSIDTVDDLRSLFNTVPSLLLDVQHLSPPLVPALVLLLRRARFAAVAAAALAPHSAVADAVGVGKNIFSLLIVPRSPSTLTLSLTRNNPGRVWLTVARLCFTGKMNVRRPASDLIIDLAPIRALTFRVRSSERRKVTNQPTLPRKTTRRLVILVKMLPVHWHTCEYTILYNAVILSCLYFTLVKGDERCTQGYRSIHWYRYTLNLTDACHLSLIIHHVIMSVVSGQLLCMSNNSLMT